MFVYTNIIKILTPNRSPKTSTNSGIAKPMTAAQTEPAVMDFHSGALRFMALQKDSFVAVAAVASSFD